MLLTDTSEATNSYVKVMFLIVKSKLLYFRTRTSHAWKIFQTKEINLFIRTMAASLRPFSPPSVYAQTIAQRWPLPMAIFYGEWASDLAAARYRGPIITATSTLWLPPNLLFHASSLVQASAIGANSSRGISNMTASIEGKGTRKNYLRCHDPQTQINQKFKRWDFIKCCFYCKSLTNALMIHIAVSSTAPSQCASLRTIKYCFINQPRFTWSC